MVRKPAQLDPIGGVFGWWLDAEAMREIDKILEEAISAPIGPAFMAPRQNRRLERSCTIVETFRGVRDATPNLPGCLVDLRA